MGLLLPLLLALSGAPDLKPCEDVRSARCTQIVVAENPGAQKGRKISLDVLVQKATTRNRVEDPLFFLAGGPGQAATELAPQLIGIFRDINKTRDLVFVDQRGTGSSNPLDCESKDQSLAKMLSDEFDFAELQACRKSYDADLAFYTSIYAAKDLDDVRKALGYKTINLMGVSYGTRMGMVYAQTYPDQTRALILDGNAPSEIKLPLHTGADALRAFAATEKAYGKSLSLDDIALPQTVTMAHPQTGVPETVTFTQNNVAAIIRSALYSTVTASLVPLAVEQAKRNDFRALSGLASSGAGGISIGMFMSVVCNEDFPHISDEEKTKIDGVFLNAKTLASFERACADWPKAETHTPKEIDARTLLLSGALDPVTPPRWGEVSQARMKNAQHVVVPNTGHGTWSKRCIRKLMLDFLDDKTLDQGALQSECLDKMRRESFFKDERGP